MQTFKFKAAKGGKIAVSTDPKGSNLPQELGPWTYMGARKIDAADGPRVGKGSADIVADLNRDGYSILPE